uniref:Uncharacterized protein n=1 Tax=Octopus bimaculoides TaxID=37653 RepID=A0A0L8FQ94_OCTBM
MHRHTHTTNPRYTHTLHITSMSPPPTMYQSPSSPHHHSNLDACVCVCVCVERYFTTLNPFFNTLGLLLTQNISNTLGTHRHLYSYSYLITHLVINGAVVVFTFFFLNGIPS